MRCATSKMCFISFRKCLSCMVVPFFLGIIPSKTFGRVPWLVFFLFVHFRHLNDIPIFMVLCKRGEFPYSILCTCFDQNGNESIKNGKKNVPTKQEHHACAWEIYFNLSHIKHFQFFKWLLKFHFQYDSPFFIPILKHHTRHRKNKYLWKASYVLMWRQKKEEMQKKTDQKNMKIKRMVKMCYGSFYFLPIFFVPRLQIITAIFLHIHTTRNISWML